MGGRGVCYNSIYLNMRGVGTGNRGVVGTVAGFVIGMRTLKAKGDLGKLRLAL